MKCRTSPCARSILDRFCAPLCETVTEVSAGECQEIIEWIARANLFLVPLDEEGGWYRNHHLFADLLRHELGRQASASDISALHARAGAWFAQNGLIDEALHHYFTAGNTAAAADLVARHRYALMNGVEWPRLDRYLRRFSPTSWINIRICSCETWLIYHVANGQNFPRPCSELKRPWRRHR